MVLSAAIALQMKKPCIFREVFVAPRLNLLGALADFHNSSEDTEMAASSAPVLDSDKDVKSSDLMLGDEHNLRSSSMDAPTKAGKLSPSKSQQILPERDMGRVQEGVEAFERERESLINAKKLNHIVAYEAGRRVAIEPNHKKLHKRLDKIKTLRRSDLFIACVSPPPSDDEPFLSR